MSCASHAVSVDYPNIRPIWWSVTKLYFLCFLYGRETTSLAVMKERVLTRMYLREERTGGWRKVHNEDFSVLHWYFVLFGPLNWAGCLDRFTAHMWEGWQRCNYKMLNVMPGRTRWFSTCRRRWKRILRMIFGKQAVETDWIHLVWIARWSAVWFLLNRGFTLPLINFEPKWIRLM
jgi:hypothetical protein